MKISVQTAFRLLLADATVREFPVGVHEVDEEIADHWYVKHHLGAVAPDPGLRVDVVALLRREEEVEAREVALEQLVKAARDDNQAEEQRLAKVGAELKSGQEALKQQQDDLKRQQQEFAQKVADASKDPEAAGKDKGKGK